MIYLDYASATPVSEAAKTAMEPYFSEKFFNPSSPYLAAKRVREDYEAAKATLAHTIGAKPDDLIITSGATEANNLAFSILDTPNSPKALVLETEHASILENSKNYQKIVKIVKNYLMKRNFSLYTIMQAKEKQESGLFYLCLVAVRRGVSK